MGVRTSFDPAGSEDVMVDGFIGTAYKNVRIVAQGMALIKRVADALGVSGVIPNVGLKGDDGNPGKSSYDLWLEAGNSGNLAAFLNSLKGLPGNAGKSAYQLWIEAGNTGNIATFLNALRGDPGTTGRGIVSTALNSSSHLIITYSDGATQDAGQVGTGSSGGGGTPTPTPVPTLSMSASISTLEGNSGTTLVTNVITVNRDGVTGPLVVNLSYSGSATSGTDYQAGPSTVTIESGQNSASFNLLINGDMDVETNETIVIGAVLAAYQNATASRTITITNDDVLVSANPTISITAAISHNEGDNGQTVFEYVLSLNRDGSTAAIPYDWTVEGYGSNPADKNDFGGVFPSGSGSFAPSQNQKVIQVFASADVGFEADEKFLLRVVGPNIVTAQGTIINDDAAQPTGEVQPVYLIHNNFASWEAFYASVATVPVAHFAAGIPLVFLSIGTPSSASVNGVPLAQIGDSPWWVGDSPIPAGDYEIVVERTGYTGVGTVHWFSLINGDVDPANLVYDVKPGVYGQAGNYHTDPMDVPAKGLAIMAWADYGRGTDTPQSFTVEAPSTLSAYDYYYGPNRQETRGFIFTKRAAPIDSGLDDVTSGITVPDGVYMPVYTLVVAPASVSTARFTASPTVSGTNALGQQQTITNAPVENQGSNTVEARWLYKRAANAPSSTVTPTKPGTYTAQNRLIAPSGVILDTVETDIVIGGTVAGISDEQASRFLTQATMGATNASIAEIKSKGYATWIDEQQAMAVSKTVWDRLNERAPQTLNDPNYNVGDSNNAFDNAVWDLLITAPDQLRYRVATALLDFIVIGMPGLPVNFTKHAMANHVDILAAYAFGNYRALLRKVTYSAAMGMYLSYHGNKKQDIDYPIRNNPDENYAREIMQLFSFGLFQLNMDGSVKTDGNGKLLETYVQSDVSQLARIFTGLISTPEFGYNTALVFNHDMVMDNSWNEKGPSTFLGTTVTGGGHPAIETALDVIFNNPSVPPFVCKQLIQRLVTSNPSPAYVQRISTIFANNGSGVRGDLKAVIKAILLDTEARALTMHGRLKNPVLRLTAWARAVGMTAPISFGNTSSQGSGIGMSTGQSPSVFNFYRPGYTPPSSPIQAQGLLAPEMQIENDQSVLAFINYMKAVIDANPSSLTLQQLDVLLASGQLTPETITSIQAAIDSVSVSADKTKIATLLTTIAPEFLVGK